jgi:hypothetical protein
LKKFWSRFRLGIEEKATKSLGFEKKFGAKIEFTKDCREKSRKCRKIHISLLQNRLVFFLINAGQKKILSLQITRRECCPYGHKKCNFYN